MQLTRMTTCFVEEEDRFLVSGDSDAGIINLWLTQRLLKRLLPHLLAWVEKVEPAVQEGLGTVSTSTEAKTGQVSVESNASGSLKKANQTTAQLAALHRKPVSPVASEQAVYSCLVQALRLQLRGQVVRLAFELPDNEEAVLLLREEHARIWLSVLYKHWLKGQWPDIWPDWVKQAQQQGIASPVSLVH